MELPPGFEFSEAHKDEIPDLFSLWNDAFVDYEVWKVIFKDSDPKEIFPWLVKTFRPRWTMDDITMWKVTEVSSGKIVAWTGLRYPWKFRPSVTEAQKKMVQAKGMPSTLEGANLDVFAVLAHAMGAASDYGYDPENDYHRAGTNVLPGYQRMGFGQFLTQHCNGIADKSGCRTWIPASPNGCNMFKKKGFKEVAVLDAHLEQYGYDAATGKIYILLRDAPPRERKEMGLEKVNRGSRNRT